MNTKGNIYGAFGGATFGCLAWIYRVSYYSGDWWTPIWVTITGVAIFWISTHYGLRNAEENINKAGMLALGMLATVNFLFINLNPSVWQSGLMYGLGQTGVNMLMASLFAGLFLWQGFLEWKRRLRAA